jgi:hypothetical protein
MALIDKQNPLAWLDRLRGPRPVVARIDVDEFRAAERDPAMKSFAAKAEAYRTSLREQGKSA